MAKPFNELRERLLRAGVAPRHVRRYLAELTDHLADLRAEEERAGRSRADAESAALTRLGGMDDLFKAMVEQRQFQSWCFRAPWATYCVAPIFLLAGAYFVACFILWSGWKVFMPGMNTPFVRLDGLDGFAIFYFGVGRLIYFGAPIVIAWGIGVIAARQRSREVWPTIGLVLIALIGCTTRVHASRSAFPGGVEHVSMGFGLGPSAQGSLLYALVILSLTVLPYLIWRLQKAHSLSA